MLSIKRKLSSKSGASMLLAMVFLMFCLFIGGSVLAAATANGSRVEHLKNDQQDYLSQRSAMLLMADMLTGRDGKELQVTITDVTITSTPVEGGEATTHHTVTLNSPNFASGEAPTILQKLLFEIIASDNHAEGVTLRPTNLGISANAVDLDTKKSGKISLTVSIQDPPEQVSLVYEVNSEDYTLSIQFETDSKLKLVMDGSVGTSTEKIVTIGNMTSTTRTTVIRWSEPVVEK